MTAAEHLQRQEPECDSQVTLPAVVQVGVEVCQRKRHPLHRREVQLADAEEPRRSREIDHAAQHGTGTADAEPPRQDIGAQPAQHARGELHQIECQHQVARQPNHRRCQQRATQQVLGVGQRP